MTNAGNTLPGSNGWKDEALCETVALQNAIVNSANFSSIATDAKGAIQLFHPRSSPASALAERFGATRQWTCPVFVPVRCSCQAALCAAVR